MTNEYPKKMRDWNFKEVTVNNRREEQNVITKIKRSREILY